MAHQTEAKQDLLKQNFELTLIIIFIGLAFGLVGLIVQTAAVMSIVVISVGVIVGFVSYRDAFIPRPNGEVALNSAIPQNLPAPSIAVKPEPRPQQSAPRPQQIATTPQQMAPRPQQAAPKPQQIEEPLPRLPKITRLTASEEPTFSSPIKPTNIAPQRVGAPVQPIAQQVMQPTTSAPSQDRLAKPRKTRTRKTVDSPSVNEQSKD